MEPSPPPPASPVAVPKLSSTALYAIVGISIAVIVAIFGAILLFYTGGLSNQLWLIGLCGLVFALLFYLVFAATHNRTIAGTMAGAFFVIGAGAFYGSIAVGTGDGANKLLWMVFLSVFVVIVLAVIFYMSSQGERDAIRKSQRKVTP